jgi:murein DD-endopeptidase MepM/ murein hydrolase activator NlpD
MSGTVLFRPALRFVAALCLTTSTLHAEESASSSQSPPSPYPLQLESVVPFAPTAFASDGRQHLVYELVLRNFESKTLELQQLDVLDAAYADAPPVAVFTADALPALVRRVGGRTQEASTIMPSSGSITDSVISRRYAFDWVQVQNGEMHAGDESSNTSYFGYGEALVAVADGVVVSVMDEVPENLPGRAPALPITLANTTGNKVVLDIGEGHYAHYMHLKDGSLRVKAGDRVRRGQALGVIGNSGDSFLPHLHFEVTTSPAALAGEGVPYVFESFQVISEEGGASVTHSTELPLEKMLVNFGG